MRGTESYMMRQAGAARPTKETLGTRAQAENFNAQVNGNADSFPLMSKKIVKPTESEPKKRVDAAAVDIASKKRPVEPEVMDMTTKESRAKFQEEVNAAMPQMPVGDAGDNPDIDIDLADEFDPTLLGMYAKEIFAYLTVVEKHSGFPLNGVSSELPAKHIEYTQEGTSGRTSQQAVSGSTEYGMNAYTRAKIIDFVSSIHSKMSLCNESIFLCIQFIDKVNYLEGALGKSDGATRTINKFRPQKRLIDNPYLLALTCLFIANKYEDRYTPRLKDFIRFSGNKFLSQDVIEYERRVLKLLDYALYCPTPIVFLRRFCRIDDTSNRERYMSFLVGEMCFRSPVLSSLRPSLLAAAILGYVNQVTGKPVWTDKLTMYSNITESDIKGVMKNISHFVNDYDRSFYSSVKSKYVNQRYHGAWELFVSTV